MPSLLSVLASGRASRRALCLACGLLAGAAAAEAAGETAPPAVQRAAKADATVDFARLPENRRLHILIGLSKSGRHEQAARLLEAAPFTGPLARNRTLFVAGLIDKARGDMPGSSAKFRAVLAENPELSLVRAELAHSLYMMEDDASARHHLDLLIGSAPTPELARTFDSFIDAIDARRPWQVSAYLTLAPSTNFNNGSNHETVLTNGLPFTIDAPSRKKSGVGVTGGVNGSYRFRLSDKLSVVTGAGVNFREYKSDAFDDVVVTENVTLEHNSGRTRVALGIRADQQWSNVPEYDLIDDAWRTRDNFSFSVGPVLSVTHRFTNKLALYSRLRMSWNRNRQLGHLNGITLENDNRLSYTLGESTVVYALNGFGRTKTRRDHLDNWSVYGGLGFYNEFSHGITLYTEARATRRVYDGDYPGRREARKDHRFDFSSTLTKRDLNLYGFAPQLEYRYVHQSSNVPFDDFDGHSGNFTLTRSF